jgi:hypothetical protein
MKIMKNVSLKIIALFSFLLLTSGLIFAQKFVSNVSGIPVTGDVDGDGKSEYMVVTNTSWYTWFSTTQWQIRGGPYTLNVSGTPATGDFDGDELADFVIFAGSSWYVWWSGAQYMVRGGPYSMGISGTPAVGDLDGDRLADIGIYQEATGQWVFLLSAINYAVYTWGQTLGGAGWSPILADFDGDGKADPTVYEENTGTWIFALSGNNYVRDMQTGYSGGTGWSGLAGDFNGDSLADAVVYERASGTWRVILTEFILTTVTNVTASLGSFQNYIQVSWSASAEAASYEVYRFDTTNYSYPSTNYLIGATAATTYADVYADSGKIYYYRVRAVNAAGQRSGFSAPATGRRFGPDVRVNGSHGPVSVSLGSAVTVTVQMDPGSAAWNADFWVVAVVSGTLYYLDSSNLSLQWLPVTDLSQAHPVYQGALFYLPSITVLDRFSWLPRGAYAFYFAVDAMDGVLDLNNVWFDSVALTVQ